MIVGIGRHSLFGLRIRSIPQWNQMASEQWATRCVTTCSAANSEPLGAWLLYLRLTVSHVVRDYLRLTVSHSVCVYCICSQQWTTRCVNIYSAANSDPLGVRLLYLQPTVSHLVRDCLQTIGKFKLIGGRSWFRIWWQFGDFYPGLKIKMKLPKVHHENVLRRQLSMSFALRLERLLKFVCL